MRVRVHVCDYAHVCQVYRCTYITVCIIYTNEMSLTRLEIPDVLHAQQSTSTQQLIRSLFVLMLLSQPAGAAAPPPALSWAGWWQERTPGLTAGRGRYVHQHSAKGRNTLCSDLLWSDLLCSGVAAGGHQRALETRLRRHPPLSRLGPHCRTLHQVCPLGLVVDKIRLTQQRVLCLRLQWAAFLREGV